NGGIGTHNWYFFFFMKDAYTCFAVMGFFFARIGIWGWMLTLFWMAIFFICCYYLFFEGFIIF
ncbi:hypothetical protein, partial [Photobacterium sp. R1]